MEPAWLKLKLRSKPISSYHKVPQVRFTPGTGCESGEPATTERRMVWFGKGRLETQVKLCADRLLHFILGFSGPKTEAIEIKQKIQDFLNTLKLTLSAEKTLITHATTGRARFLGYEGKMIRN